VFPDNIWIISLESGLQLMGLAVIACITVPPWLLAVRANQPTMKEIDMLKSLLVKTGSVVVSGLIPILLWAGPVDVNTADAETIARELNGVGSARAEAIVDYRNEYGSFQSADDLLNVAGIGRHILDVNRANILVEKNQ
jgi:competence protein ComEA